MKAITVRNLSPELARFIRDEARRQGQSLNRTVIALLEQAAGLVRPTKPRRYHDLDKYIGTMTDEDAEIVMKAVEEQRQIEPEMWT